MGYMLFKAFLTGLIVAGVSELAKRSSLLAAVLASVPLTSILAMIWLYTDTNEIGQVTALSKSIFWMVLPSLFFFIAFPLLAKWGFRFYPALSVAIVLMFGVYWGYVRLLQQVGVEI